MKKLIGRATSSRTPSRLDGCKSFFTTGVLHFVSKQAFYSCMTSFTSRAALTALSIFLSLCVTWADAEGLDGVVALEPYVVQATRLESTAFEVPAAFSVIDQGSIQRASAQLSINEALQTVPGVFVLNPYNYAQDSRIAIRGFGARSNFGIRGVRLVVDGIPATLPDGQGGVDGIDLGSAQSIEILRGPSASIYGPASGGVIRIETESAPEGVFAESRFTAGDYGLQKTQFKSGWGSAAWNALVSSSYLDYEGYRGNSRTINSAFNTKLRHRGEDGAELTMVVNVIDYPVQDDAGGLTAAEVEQNPRQARAQNLQFDAGESVRQHKLGFAYRRPLGDVHELRLNAFMLERDFANKLPFLPGGQVQFDRQFYGGGVAYGYTESSFRLVAGLELAQQVDDRSRYDNLNGVQGPLVLEQEEKVSNFGGYVTGELDLTEAFSLNAALRYDTVQFDVDDRFLADGDDAGDITFEQVSPSGGFRWMLSPDFTFYGHVATSFETPTTTEFDNPLGGGFNNALKSQTAVSYELGVRAGLPELPWRPSFEVALFTIRIDDALVPYELAAFPGRDFYRNVGESRKDGLEAAFRLFPTDHLSATFSYTYSEFSYERFVATAGDFSGNQLPGVPEHFGNLRLDYRHPSGFSLVWNTRVVGSLYADDANTAKVDPYTFSDVRLSWERDFGSWTVEGFVGLNNVFDESYAANIRINAFGGRYYEPAPQRNMYAGLRIRYRF